MIILQYNAKNYWYIFFVVSLFFILKAFTPSSKPFVGISTTTTSSTCLNAVIAEGVEFDTIAREWRCKWSPDNDKQSLVEIQKVLNKYLPTIKKINGVTNVERIVCGGCLDFKLITSLSESSFGSWAESEFTPESDFIKELESINGVSLIETQTYTVRNNY
jgi:hypothetical protein